jgi:hypothetical protein
MKLRNLLAATVVLAALIATLYWSNRQKPIEDAAKAAANAPVKILSLNRDDISKVEVKRRDGEDIVLSRTGSGNWKITSPKPLFAEQDQISSMLYAMSPLEADRLIEEKAGDVQMFGLAEPAVEVSATGKDGKPQKLLIGDDTPTGGSAYAMLAGDPRIFTISSSAKSNLGKALKDLRDKRLLPVDYDKISKIEIISPKLNLSFGSDNGQWVLQNPKGMRGDTSKLEGVVEKLKVATMDPGVPAADAKKGAASFASGAPVATVKATDASGSEELQVRKSKDDYYAKTTAMDGAYKVSKEFGEAINKNLDDFREKRLFDFAESNPEKIEMHSGAKAYFLTRSGDDWWWDGKKMDPVSVDSVVRELRQLSAVKFATSGFSSSAIALTVTSDGGKRVEKVTLSKNGKGYVAKRESDPLLYELEAKGVEDLQKAVDDIKPVEAPKK